MEQSDDERWARGECGSLHPCLGPEAGSRPRSPPVGVCPERVCCCLWGTPLFLAETLMFPSLSLKNKSVMDTFYVSGIWGIKTWSSA